jgi:hypothetical protein
MGRRESPADDKADDDKLPPGRWATGRQVLTLEQSPSVEAHCFTNMLVFDLCE